MLQGITDGMTLLKIEWDKYCKMYAVYNYDNLYSTISQIEMNISHFQQEVNNLRKKGL
jgi:hypothetical protein